MSAEDLAASEPGSRRWKVSHAAAAFGAGILASLVATALVWPGGVTVLETFAVVGPAQTLVTIAVVAWLRRAPGRPPLGVRPAGLDALGVLLGIGLAFGLSYLTWVVMRLLGSEVPEQSVVQVADRAVGLGTRAALVITAVLLAPLAEELVFRGILLRALERRLSGNAAGLVSAAAFALVHLALDPMAWAAVPALFVVGWVLATAMQRTGRVSFAVAGHLGFNLAGVVALLGF